MITQPGQAYSLAWMRLVELRTDPDLAGAMLTQASRLGRSTEVTQAGLVTVTRVAPERFEVQVAAHARGK
jgi:hypothetical protein